MPKDKALVESYRNKIAAAAFSISEYRIELLATAVDVIENLEGCTTPVEEFLTDLLSDYPSGWVKPDGMDHRISVFRENVELMAPAARLFARQFPELMKETELTEKEEE